MKSTKAFRLIIILLITIIVVGCSPALSGRLPLFRPDTSTVLQEKVPGQLVQIEEIIIGMLLLSAVVGLGSQRLRIPYTLGLVIVGFGLTLIGTIPTVNIVPEIILALLVPPLVFEAAFYLNWKDLRKELPLILLMTIPGVILTTLLVGGFVAFSTGILLPYALVFGALIAATDPVAVVALFRSLGAPKRLQVLLEGESLLNDGTAIVLFNLMIAIAIMGQFSFGKSIIQFIIVAGGGVLIGGIIGYIVSNFIGRIDSPLIETTLTTVLAYGSYLIAEYVFGVSGVLAVVAAGLAIGQIGPRGMSPTTRIVVFNFWEYAAFIANTFIFLIIGLQINIHLLLDNALAIGWAILAVLIARAVTVYGLSWIGHNIPTKWKHVMFWGGLRGAISLALALSLPINFPNRNQLQAMAFGVVLFTLLVEGLSMRSVLSRLGIIQQSETQREYNVKNARAIAMRSAQASVLKLNKDGLISEYTWQTIKPMLEKRVQQLADEIQRMIEQEPSLRQEELGDAWREALQTIRSTYTSLYRDNIINEDVYTELVSEVDVMLTDPNSTWAEIASEFQVDETGESS
jgi:monovalent cation:H+ antiporter, CPA1 family